MRVGIQTWGSEGDLRPFFALGQGLAARGHDVTLAYTSIEGRRYDALAAACGVRAISAGSEQFARPPGQGAEGGHALLRASPVAQLRWIVERYQDPVIEPMWAAAQALAADSDVLVAHFVCHGLAAAAERAGRPLVAVATAPVVRTRAVPPPGMPSLGPLNGLAWSLVERHVDRIFLARANALRARAGLPALRHVHGGPQGSVVRVLTAVSPTLFPQPPDWGPEAPVVGFLDFERPAEAWAPDAALEAFLSAGPPPVLMTFGSMMSLPGMAPDAARLLAGAAAAAGVRALIQAPAGLAPAVEGIRFVERLPHAAVLPRCAAVVHHGGAGTTQAATLAGRPSVVVPHGVDQPFWGAALHARGAAPAPLPRHRASVARLARRIREAVASRPMRARAEALGAAMRAERGVERAAEIIEGISRAR